jgi:hypothetical protein
VRRPPLGQLGRAVALALALAALLGPVAAAEQTGGGGILVRFDGRIVPKRLPRDRPAPLSVELAGSVAGDEGMPAPRLRRIELDFGAPGGLETAGLPVCPRARLRNATARQALRRCGGALVGRGKIGGEVPLSPQEPIPVRAGVLAFNGRSGGRPAVWVHAYSPSPPVSFVLPFYLRQPRSGAYGIRLRAPLAKALGHWPRLRSFRLLLGRRYRAGGTARSYLSASCPLPPRLHVGLFPLARATYLFAGSSSRSVTILRGCRVRD